MLLRENDQVPADIVVLSTPEPDGLYYLETMNLDGETKLKSRKSLSMQHPHKLRKTLSTRHSYSTWNRRTRTSTSSMASYDTSLHPMVARASNPSRSMSFRYADARSGTQRGSSASSSSRAQIPKSCSTEVAHPQSGARSRRRRTSTW